MNYEANAHDEDQEAAFENNVDTSLTSLKAASSPEVRWSFGGRGAASWPNWWVGCSLT